MKVSHELPNNMLHMSKEINDYEYCLPHLMDDNLNLYEYRDYFLQAKKDGRYIIMDNSLHELGKAYAEDRLHYWIEKLKPDEFIVPDVWQNMTSTLVNAKRWSTINFPKEWKVTKVAVVQAEDYAEAVECYSILKTHHGYNKIAFSYGADYYARMVPHPNPLVGKMLGRIMTISNMYKDGVIGKNDRIHLLGCALPQEFTYYRDFPFIESIDTSNPIIHGLKGIKYKHYGLLDKDTTKIDQLEEVELTSDVLYNINHNLIRFKQFIK